MRFGNDILPLLLSGWLEKRVHRSWTRTPSHHHWGRCAGWWEDFTYTHADVNALIASSDLSWNKIVILLTRKSRRKSLVNGSLESAQGMELLYPYPESSIYCRRDTGPPYIFCGTCIPVQWTVSMVSDMQAMTSELSCSTELSSLCYTEEVLHLFVLHMAAHAYATLPIHPAPFSLLPPHPHIFSLCLSSFSCPTNVAL